jgi:hypothetical protein
MDADQPSRVVVPAEEFLARLRERAFRRSSLLEELTADAEAPAAEHEMAEGEAVRRRPHEGRVAE